VFFVAISMIMHIQPGTLITSMPSLTDTEFEEVTIFIAEYNLKGAMGFVTNKLFARRLNELEEFKHVISFPLYDGGPVDREHLFFIHQRPGLVDKGTQITNSIYLGGNFKQAVDHINAGRIKTKDIKIFVGYCGWDPYQLEAEIEEGSWKITERNDPFS
jgi:putative transcriptional regulator